MSKCCVKVEKVREKVLKFEEIWKNPLKVEKSALKLI